MARFLVYAGFLSHFRGTASLNWFLASTFASAIGRNAYALACSWILVVSGQGSSAVVAFFAIVSATELVASPIAGSICDRYDRHLIFIIVDSIRAIAAALLAVTLNAADLQWTIWVSAILYASCDRVALTASQAMIPSVDTRFTSATSNSIVFFSMQSGSLAAAVLIGGVLDESSVMVAFTSIATAFALSVCSMLFSRQKQNAPEPPGEAARCALRIDGHLVHLGAAYALLYVGGFLVSVMGPGFVFEELSGDALDFGTLESAWSVGSILGTILLIPLLSAAKMPTLQFVILATTALSFAMLKLLVMPWALFVFAILGTLYNLGRVAIEVSLQSTVPSMLLGRAKGVLHCAGVLLGLMLFGLIASVSDHIRPSTIFLLFAAFLASAIMMLTISQPNRTR